MQESEVLDFDNIVSDVYICNADIGIVGVNITSDNERQDLETSCDFPAPEHLTTENNQNLNNAQGTLQMKNNGNYHKHIIRKRIN